MKNWIFLVLCLVGYQIHDTLACPPRCAHDASCRSHYDCRDGSGSNNFDDGRCIQG